MTIIALQKESVQGLYGSHDFEILRVTADSRLSNTTGHGFLTDLAPKIFPVEMRSARGGGDLNRFAPYGFAYSGSSLAASLSHFTTQYLLTNLFSNDIFLPPTVEEVAKVYRDVGILHMRQLSQLFSAVVFGYEVGGGGYKAYSLEPSVSSDLVFNLAEIDVANTIYRAGSGSQHFDVIRSQKENGGELISCFSIVKEMIEEQVHQSVGGFIQTGFVDERGLQQDSIISGSGGSDLEIVTYLGLDLATVFRPSGYKYGQNAIVISEDAAKVPEFIHTTQ